MKVLDLIGPRRQVFFISEEANVHEGARYLREKQVRSVGVLDAQGQLAGVLSQSDVSDKVAAENRCPAWMKVSEIMSRDLVTVTPEMSLEECLSLMEKNGIYHLLVVEREGGYRGMVSVSDLLRVMVNDEKERADLLQALIDPVR